MNCRYRGGWLLFVCSNSKKSCCVCGREKGQLTGQVYVRLPLTKRRYTSRRKEMNDSRDRSRSDSKSFVFASRKSCFVICACCFLFHVTSEKSNRSVFFCFVCLWRRRCRDGVSCGSSPTTRIGCIVDRSFRPMPPMTTIVIPSMNCRNACPIVDPHPHIIRAPLF